MFRSALVLLVVVVAVAAAPNVRKLFPDGRIVGGQTTNITAHPYQVTLKFAGSHMCGGALIATNWVLTAAHCVDSSFIQAFLDITVGTTFINSGGVSYSPTRFIVHQKYGTEGLDFDIALIELAQHVVLGPSVGIVRLPAAYSELPAGTNVVVTGWGDTKENSGAGSNVLLEVTVPVVSNAQCDFAYGYDQVTSNMLCLGVLEGGKDACQGDSGGPAVNNGRVVGIVSWGNGCARPNYPGVYTSVAAFVNWINDNSGVNP